MSFTATSDVWTGLNDLFLSGVFTWTDQHIVTFTYWAPGAPSNHEGFSEDCVEMLHEVRKMEIVLHTVMYISCQNFSIVHPSLRNLSCPYRSFCFLSAPDWPMERRVLCRTQYLHMQNAQSTLPSAICESHRVRMPSGRTASNQMFYL